MEQIADHPWTQMDRYGDRFARRNGKWAKISKQRDGRYLVANGWRGQVKAAIGEIYINIPKLGTAKRYAHSWLDDR